MQCKGSRFPLEVVISSSSLHTATCTVAVSGDPIILVGTEISPGGAQIPLKPSLLFSAGRNLAAVLFMPELIAGIH